MYPSIIWMNTIRSMQKEGKKWHVQQELGSGEARAIVVGERRGNRLFFNKVLQDSRTFEKAESGFAAKKAALSQAEFWQERSEIQQFKLELAASYKGTQAITKKLVNKSYLFPIGTFCFGVAMALIGDPEHFALDPIVKRLFFSIGATSAFAGFGRLLRAVFLQSRICNMFDKIGIKLYDGPAVDPFDI